MRAVIEKISGLEPLRAVAMIAAAFVFSMAAEARSLAKSEGALTQTQKIIQEAEKLSLEKDRTQASSALWRAIKKNTDKQDDKILREKLFQLSHYFYTDKGFQSFLAAKELFNKQKYTDALEKLSDADELETGNADVLHYLALTYLWLKKTDLAEITNRRALQICPIDAKLVRDQLAVQREQGAWVEAQKTAELLSKEYGDTSAQTLKDWGRAILSGAEKGGEAELAAAEDQARKFAEQAIARDPKFAEAYELAAEVAPKAEAAKFLTKYIELCKNTKMNIYPREMAGCSHLVDAQKKASQ